MKTYIDYIFTIQFGNICIPKTSSNSDYAQFLEEQAKGEAELVPYNPYENITVDEFKVMKKNEWRAARKPLLEKLDVEYMRALETKDIKKQQEVIAKKQALRQVTDISLPNTIEEIKNVWPDILNSEK